jgi:hypothetical protein
MKVKMWRKGAGALAASLMVAGLVTCQPASAATGPAIKQDAFARQAAAAGYSQSEIAAIQAAGKEDVFPVNVRENSPVPTVRWSPPRAVVAATSAGALPKYDVSTGCANYPHTISATSAVTRQTLMSFTTTDHICWRRYHQGYCPCTHFQYDILSWYSPAMETAMIQHHVSAYADTAGWGWSGLDDVGNVDTVTSGNVYFRRQGHFSYSFGFGPLAIHKNWYPYTGFRFIGNSTGMFVYYAGGAA